MEDVLTVLARPYDAGQPVIALDERPMVLCGASRPVARCGRAGRPGRTTNPSDGARRSIVERKTGRHLTLRARIGRRRAQARLLALAAAHLPTPIVLSMRRFDTK